MMKKSLEKREGKRLPRREMSETKCTHKKLDRSHDVMMTKEFLRHRTCVEWWFIHGGDLGGQRCFFITCFRKEQYKGLVVKCRVTHVVIQKFPCFEKAFYWSRVKTLFRTAEQPRGGGARMSLFLPSSTFFIFGLVFVHSFFF